MVRRNSVRHTVIPELGSFVKMQHDCCTQALLLTWQTEGLETTTLKLQLPLIMSCAGYIGLMKLMNISEP